MSNYKSGSDENFTFKMVDFYGIVKIKGVTIPNTNIESLNIVVSCFNLIPVLDMSFGDNGIFSQLYPLEDGDEIEVVLAKSDITNQVVNAKFTLNDFTIQNIDGDQAQSSIVNLTAYLKSSNLFQPVKTRAFRSMNSAQVMNSLASECGLGFSSKITPSDSMTWRQINSTNFDMFAEVLGKSYINNDGIIAGIGLNGEFLLTSVKTAQNNKKSKKAIFSPEKTISNIVDEKETVYFNNYTVVNNMGTTNKTGGYGISYSTYDLKSDVKTKEIEDSYKILTKYLYKNKENAGKLVGKYGTQIQNFQNVHKNYLDAQAQNEYYLNDFFKNSLILFASPTKEVNLFDVLDVTFPSVQNASTVNTVLSGKYVVGGISFSASKAGFFRSALVLFRNGFNQGTQIKNGQYTSI